MKVYLPLEMAGGLEMRTQPKDVYLTLEEAKSEFINTEWEVCSQDPVAWCPKGDMSYAARIIELDLKSIIDLDQIRLSKSSSDLLMLTPNLMIVPYPSGSIGIVETNEQEHTIRQIAYYDATKRQWHKNDGENALANVLLK